jgi:hypothetical protein
VRRRFDVPMQTLASVMLAASLLLTSGLAIARDGKTTKSSSGKSEAKPAAEAKAAPATDAQHDAMMAAMMKYATPSDEHKALNPLVGSWKTTMKAWMGPGEPQVSEGTCDRAWAMGGRYLIANYKGDFGGMPFEGMEVLAYDRMKQQYTGTWIDNMGTAISLSQGGKMDPTTKTLTLLSKTPDPMTGAELAIRNVTSIVDDNTHTFSMYATRDGKENKEMEITFTRRK